MNNEQLVFLILLVFLIIFNILIITELYNIYNYIKIQLDYIEKAVDDIIAKTKKKNGDR